MPICVARAVSVGEFIGVRRSTAPAGIHRFRETEVQHLHRAVGADLDVRGLQIAMDDALLVRGFERVGDLLRDRQRVGERDRAARDERGQILALDQLHHERGEVGCLLESVDRGDVRMIERGEHFGFALKAREAIGVAGDRRRQHLDRDRPFQIAVGRAIDLAHAAGADGGDDFVGAEARAGGEGQGGVIIRAATAPQRSMQPGCATDRTIDQGTSVFLRFADGNQ